MRFYVTIDDSSIKHPRQLQPLLSPLSLFSSFIQPSIHKTSVFSNSENSIFNKIFDDLQNNILCEDNQCGNKTVNKRKTTKPRKLSRKTTKSLKQSRKTTKSRKQSRKPNKTRKTTKPPKSINKKK